MRLVQNKLLALLVLFTMTLLDVQHTYASEMSVTLADQELQLNGVGLRKKGPFKVYQASLYLSQKANSTEAIISQAGPKRVSLQMLRSVGKKNMVDAIVAGFKANTADMSTIQAEVDQFVTMISDAKKRQSIVFDYVPNVGTTITQAGLNKGTIKGSAFFEALLRVWLGDKPVNPKLKAGLLGS